MRKKLLLYIADNPILSTILDHAPKYFGSSFISAIAGVLMAKYYTHVFSPADFGIQSLYLLLFQYLSVFVSFSVDASSQRVYFDYKGDDRKEFFGTVFIFMTASALFWILVSIPVAGFAVRQLGGSLSIFFVTVALTIAAAFGNFLMRMCYNEHESRVIFRQTLVNNFSSHGLSFLFIQFARLGVLGRQLGQTIAHLINGTAYAIHLFRKGYMVVRFHFRKDIFKRLMHFAYPTFITTALAATFGYVDRILLNHYHGPKHVGVYSLGLMIGQGILLISQSVSMALMPSVMKELQTGYDDSIKKVKKFDILFCSGLIVVATVASLASHVIVALISNKSYATAGELLPFVFFSYVVAGFYVTVSTVLGFHSVVWFYPYSTVVSYGTSAALNFYLIPRYQEIGAAYASFIGTFLYSFFINWVGTKYYYSKKTVLLVYGTMLVAMTLLFLHHTGNLR